MPCEKKCTYLKGISKTLPKDRQLTSHHCNKILSM